MNDMITQHQPDHSSFLEVILTDGSHYSLYSLNACDGILDLAIVQIGDVRPLTDKELDEKLNVLSCDSEQEISYMRRNRL